MTIGWALYQQDGNLFVAELISCGVRTFATVDRMGRRERVNRVYIAGVFPSENDAFAARNMARYEVDPASMKAAIKSARGYRPLP